MCISITTCAGLNEFLLVVVCSSVEQGFVAVNRSTNSGTISGSKQHGYSDFTTLPGAAVEAAVVQHISPCFSGTDCERYF